MYNFINGILIEKLPTGVVLDVNGVGFDIGIPLSTYSCLPDIGVEVKLLTHLCVREDGWYLYGFLTRDEKELFKLLITVSGIGPKLGLTILSGVGIENFKQAIVQADIGVLTAISGIGKKTAERMIVELKEKVSIKGKTSRNDIDTQLFAQNSHSEDSMVALISLGYKKQQAQEAIKKVLAREGKECQNVEELIRGALKYI